ncbi:ribonuclease J [Helicobacter cappadocius]|uniref:Ribonuclease J n=1 Tax=Helicobacter cappadocius TaxID=3063998 RepID=A0AA90PIU0_9HELI|nr:MULTISPECIES: ribonuclease J [unclassified Helicobacter]MDO7252513.1 ribonuclease J [Helicobacter sp. faydin-H75]MDP2538380.1 ribonuclease J [Helicobacter sp. faydin-H76]
MENNNDNINQNPPAGEGQKKRFFRPRFKRNSENDDKSQNSNSSSHAENSEKPRPRRWVGKNKNTHTNPSQPQELEAKNGVREIQSIDERGNLGFHKDLKRGVEANNRIQKNSLNPHYKLNLNTKAKVRITPLGGLGEIGGNMMVMETENSAIIIDVGMSFPEENMHGVDILIPDFNYLYAIKDKIAGVIITHAHEDHIGAVPYLYKQMQFPLYGTPLSLGMIGNKFDEHGLKKFRSFFKIVEKRHPIVVGDFEIEWIHITHSIIDASALAIRTEAGIIIHTGDFKIDHTPIDNLPTDLHRLAHYGEEGVMLLLSDSTNSHRSGVTASEASVGPTFDSLFKGAEGRVIMSTFSSNIHRVYQAITYGLKYNRKVAVIGRSMEKNLDIARELGYIDLPHNIFIEAHEVAKYPDEEVLIVTTGSQGETMSALYRMATDEHRHIKIKPTDMVIISAKAIPGNEGSVSTVLNFLMKAGARVAYQDFSEIHVSGHAAQEEQKLMLRLIKPKFFLPIHGEYNHVAKHRDTAIKCGVLEKNIYLMEDGDQVEVNPSYIRKVRTIKSGKTYIDNQVNRQIDSNVVAERQALVDCGVAILNIFISPRDQKILKETNIMTLGIVNIREEKDLCREIENALEMYIKTAKKEVLENKKTLENEIRNIARKLLFKKLKKYPTIITNTFLS